MLSGQTFQERSASFEHMYAPSRAKALFSKHTALKDLLDRDVKRMRWEWKTSDTELRKEIQIFQKRNNVLQEKVKQIEDRYFASLEEEDEDGDETSLYRPSTSISVNRSKRDANHRRSRPMTAYAPQAPAVEVKARPHSSASRHSSNTNANSRPNSGLLAHRKPQQTVRFTQPQNAEHVPVKESYRSLENFELETTSSPNRNKRERCKSAVILTKAKKYELRNQRFYEENERYKGFIKDKIDNYLDRVDQYKEDYKNMLKTERKKPPVTEADVTATEDVSGDSTMANKFQVKLMNPFGMASAFHKQHVSQQDANTETLVEKGKSESTNESQPGDIDKNGTEIAPLTAQNLAKLSLAKAELSTTPIDIEQDYVNAMPPVQKTLRIRQKLSELSGEEAKRERAKLLYEEAHAEGKLYETTMRNVTEKRVRPKTAPTKHSQLKLDKVHMREAFDEFIDSKQSIDDMQKLIAESAKMKAKTKKARDRSFVPFIAVRKAARAWKEAVAHSKAERALREK